MCVGLSGTCLTDETSYLLFLVVTAKGVPSANEEWRLDIELVICAGMEFNFDRTRLLFSRFPDWFVSKGMFSFIFFLPVVFKTRLKRKKTLGSQRRIAECVRCCTRRLRDTFGSCPASCYLTRDGIGKSTSTPTNSWTRSPWPHPSYTVHVFLSLFGVVLQELMHFCSAWPLSALQMASRMGEGSFPFQSHTLTKHGCPTNRVEQCTVCLTHQMAG